MASVNVIFSCFFSSRRRHTRYIGDWSSDVCSSDLAQVLDEPRHPRRVPQVERDRALARVGRVEDRRDLREERRAPAPRIVATVGPLDFHHIGAQPGQDLAGEGARQILGDLDDLDTRKRCAGLLSIGVRAVDAHRGWPQARCPSLHRAVRVGQSASAPQRATSRPRVAAHQPSPPNSARHDQSRRVTNWRSCSYVKPMAPWTWWAIDAPIPAASPVRALATPISKRASPRSAARNAWAAAMSAAATWPARTARFCWMAWNAPMGLPNWRRSVA